MDPRFLFDEYDTGSIERQGSAFSKVDSPISLTLLIEGNVIFVSTPRF